MSASLVTGIWLGRPHHPVASAIYGVQLTIGSRGFYGTASHYQHKGFNHYWGFSVPNGYLKLIYKIQTAVRGGVTI